MPAPLTLLTVTTPDGQPLVLFLAQGHLSTRTVRERLRQARVPGPAGTPVYLYACGPDSASGHVSLYTDAVPQSVPVTVVAASDRATGWIDAALSLTATQASEPPR